MACDIFHRVESGNRQLETHVYFIAELSTFSSLPIFSKHFHYVGSAEFLYFRKSSYIFSNTAKNTRKAKKNSSPSSPVPFQTLQTINEHFIPPKIFNIHYSKQGLIPSKTLSFLYLEHCKNLGQSVPELSYNEGKHEFMSSPCIQRKNKWESAAFQQLAHSDSKLNLGVPNRRRKTAPCACNVWKPWIPQKIKTKARHVGNPPDYFPSGILHDLLLQSVWSTPFSLFKSIFSSFCIHSIGQFQIPFFLPHLTAACSNYRVLLLLGSLLPLDPITSDNIPFCCKALSKDGKFIFPFPPGNIKDKDS